MLRELRRYQQKKSSTVSPSTAGVILSLESRNSSQYELRHLGSAQQNLLEERKLK